MSSEAEERIRAKAEAALREAFSDARIIHELVIRRGGCRIDLAAVTPTRLVVAEVKSERDVLDRLKRQVEQAREVCDGLVVVVAEKHLDKARKVAGWGDTCVEDEVGLQLSRFTSRAMLRSTTNAPARLAMLWAEELRAVGMGRGSRHENIIYAADSLTGSEVRRRVCAALRARHFPRADPPILSELFKRETRFEA